MKTYLFLWNICKHNVKISSTFHRFVGLKSLNPFQVSQLDFDTVKVTALQVIFDLLLTFGLETFDAGGTSAEEAEQEKASDDGSENLNLTLKSDDEGDEDAEMDDEEAPVKPKEKENKRSQSLIYILTDLLSSKVRAPVS